MIKKGDVIFTVDNTEQNISSLSIGYSGFSYYHCSLYIGNGQIIEATPKKGVSISNFSKYQNNKNLIARLDLTDCFFDKVIHCAKQYLGKQYNHLFLPDTDTFYCSELIHKVFYEANGCKLVFEPQFLNYIKTGENCIDQYWIDLYKKHNQIVPHGENGSHPNNLSLDKAFKQRFFIAQV